MMFLPQFGLIIDPMQRCRVSRLNGLATSGTAAAGRGATTPGASQPSGMGPQIGHYLGVVYIGLPLKMVMTWGWCK
jgi:hypothetical protein